LVPKADIRIAANSFAIRSPRRQCPHPRRSNWRRGGVEDAADDYAIGKHVEVIIVPLAGRPRERGSLEDEGLHLTASATLLLVFRRQVVAANIAINCLDDIVDDLCGF